MLKKRLIFTLLYRDGKFHLSRNFNLQAVGDLEWLKKNYDFENVMLYIDELVVLNVDRAGAISDHFLKSVRNLVKQFFIPIACGGGIKSISDAYNLLDAGADKIVVNSLMIEDRSVVDKMVEVFGSQFVVGSIDYKTVESQAVLFSRCGQNNTKIPLEDGIVIYENANVGELYLNSIQKDGTGQGFDFQTIKNISEKVRIPLIVAGGAGKPEHFENVFKIPHVDAAATANLFNFMSDGLKDVRTHLLENGIPLTNWI